MVISEGGGRVTLKLADIPEAFAKQLQEAYAHIVAGDRITLVRHPDGPLRIGNYRYKSIHDGSNMGLIRLGETAQNQGDRSVKKTKENLKFAGGIAVASLCSVALTALCAAYYYNNRLLPQPGMGLYGGYI